MLVIKLVQYAEICDSDQLWKRAKDFIRLATVVYIAFPFVVYRVTYFMITITELWD